MEVTNNNFLSVSNDLVITLGVIYDRIKVIRFDVLDTHQTIKQLDTQFNEAKLPFKALRDYAERENFNTDLICDQLTAVAGLYKKILAEQKRIITDTPEVIYHTNETTSLN